MIRKSTWIVLFVLAGLVGLSFYLRDQKAKQAAQVTPSPASATLFRSTEGSPTDIKIESSLGTSVEIGRDQTGKWVLKAPAEAPADQAAAEAAATQLGALRVLSTVKLGPDIIGLDKPAYSLTVAYPGGKAHKLNIGSVTPVQTGYYVQLDGAQSQVVDKVGLDALLGMLTQPPYLATPTPPASATPSPTPTTQAPSATPASETAPAVPTATGTP